MPLLPRNRRFLANLHFQKYGMPHANHRRKPVLTVDQLPIFSNPNRNTSLFLPLATFHFSCVFSDKRFIERSITSIAGKPSLRLFRTNQVIERRHGFFLLTVWHDYQPSSSTQYYSSNSPSSLLSIGISPSEHLITSAGTYSNG